MRTQPLNLLLLSHHPNVGLEIERIFSSPNLPNCRIDATSSAREALKREARHPHARIVCLDDLPPHELMRHRDTWHDPNRPPVVAITRGDGVFVGGKPSPFETLVRGAFDGPQLLRTIRQATRYLHLKQKLEESEARHNLLLRSVDVGLWEWDLSAGRIHFSAHWNRLVGVGETAMETLPDHWIRRVHSSNQKTLRQTLDCVREGVLPTFELKQRLRGRDGVWRLFRVTGAASRDLNGEVTRLAGSLTMLADSNMHQLTPRLVG